MKLYEYIINEFFSEYSLDECSESFEQFKIVVSSSLISVPNKENIKKFISNIPKRDAVRISISEDGASITNFSSGDNIEEFIKDLNLYLSDGNNKKYKVSLIISKKNVDDIISIYCINVFIKYMERIPLKGLFKEFSKLLVNDKISFFSIENEIECNSKSIYFYGNNKSLEINNYDRKLELKKRVKISNFLNSSECSLVPSDFDIINCTNERMKKIFYKLRDILSIISIADIAYFKDNNSVNVIINGYKNIEGLILYTNECPDEYYSVYKWIINNGNLIDKLGIARNIISLSIKENDITNLSNPLMPSIESNHSIYLRENVKEYLEIKSKVSEFLFDLCNKISELANSIGKNLFSNMVAAMTLYGTIVIINAINYRSLKDIFTKDIIYISFAFIIGSSIYMLISNFQVYYEYKRYIQIYERTKKSYNDILSEEDIKRIFKDDEYIIEDKKYILKRAIVYSISWIVLLVLMCSIIYRLGYHVIFTEILV